MFVFRLHFNRFVAYITVITHLLLFKMDDFIKVIEKNPQVCNIINNMLDRYNRLSYNHKIEIIYDNLIHNIILKELINIMATMIIDLDMEIKMKISRIKDLENKNSNNFKYIPVYKLI